MAPLLALLAVVPAVCSALLAGQPRDAEQLIRNDEDLKPTQCLREGENSLPKELEEYCLGGFRRRATAERLRETFDKEYAKRVKKAFADVFQDTGDSAMLVVQATSAGIPATRAGRFLRNFMVHAQRASKADNTSMTVVSVALDDTSMRDCNTAKEKYTKDLFRIVCTDLSGWLPAAFFEGGPAGAAEHQRRIDGIVGCGSCVYNMILWTKPTLLQAAVSSAQGSQGVLMLDLDVVLYHNPLTYIKREFPGRQGSTLLTAREGSGKANTGAVFATQQTERILSRWATHQDGFLQADAGDQSALQDLLLRLEFRSRWEKIPTSVIGQYGGKGKIGTHYNGYPGNKAAGMTKSGDWRPNEAAMYAAGDWEEGVEEPEQ